jgi:hypothetical protein
MKSHLTIHRDLILKRAYLPKTDQNFGKMRAAEDNRRRKRLLNLEHALSGGSHLWTSPN